MLSGSILAIGAVAIWNLASARGLLDQNRVRLIDTTDVVIELFDNRPTAPQPEASRNPGADRRQLWSDLGREAATKFYPDLQNNTAEYAPWIHFRRRGPRQAYLPLREHPDGGYELRRNRQGLREDRDISPDPFDGFRVLVTGDSHTAGVCANADSFANLLEADLALRASQTAVDVVNAGLGAYDFENYLGVIDYFSDLNPQVLVVAAYGGNDFSSTVVIQRYRSGRPAPSFEAVKSRKLLEAGREFKAMISQHLLQAAYFINNPDDVEPAAHRSFKIFREIARRCAKRKVTPVLVYIPPFVSAQPQHLDPELLARVDELLGRPRSQWNVSDRIADELLARTKQAGYLHLDLRPIFRASKQLLYWQTDHHINLEGHRAVADALLEIVEPIMAARQE